MKLFGTSGIRGKYPDFVNEKMAAKLAYAINKYAKGQVAVAMDPRLSGPKLKKALVDKIKQNVIDFGMVPTPVFCFGIKEHHDIDMGVMITASHNPAEYNGFKLWDFKGRAFTRDKEEEIENLMQEDGSENEQDYYKIVKEEDVVAKYKETVKNKVTLDGKLKVLIDCGNGAACDITPGLLEEYGFKIVKLNCEADGKFPNRNPEPNSDNLTEACKKVVEEKCDIGFAHDGDADRMMAIDEKGNVVDFDRFLGFISKEMTKRGVNKTVVVTVDTSMTVDRAIGEGTIVRTQVGDVFVAAGVKQKEACFGGEPSGSYIFPDFGLWPDGVFAVFKVLSFVEKLDRPLSELLEEIKKFPFSRAKFDCPNELKEKVMKELEKYVPKNSKLITLDGLFMRLKYSSILIRPSGTEPYIRVNVESEKEEKLEKLKTEWEKRVQRVIKQCSKQQ